MAPSSAALHSATVEPSLRRYLDQIDRLPMLTPEQEYLLATRWRGTPIAPMT